MSAEAVDLSQVGQAPVDIEALQQLAQQAQPEPEGPTAVEAAVGGGLSIIPIPAYVTTKKGRVFCAERFSSWGWSPFGLYAVGRWEDEAEDIERNICINGDEVESIDLQVEAYKLALEAAFEAEEAEQGAEEPEDSEDESPSD